MAETTHTIAFDVIVDDEDEHQALLRSLRDTLREADGAELDLAEAEPVEGAKGAGLAVQLSGTLVASALPVVIGLVHDWLRRRRGGCRLVVKLEGGATAEVTDIDKLDATLERLSELGFPTAE